MDNEESVDFASELIAHSLEGNALGVQDAVNAILSQKAMDAISAMKVDVAQSIYGTYGSEEQEAEMEADGPEYPEDEPEIEADEDDSTEWEVPEDEDFGLDDEELDSLWNELEDLTGDQEETDNEQEDDQDE